MIIFFDLDGTLIDSTTPIITSLQKALKSVNLDASKDTIKGLIGASLEEMFAKLGVEESQIKSILKTYKEYYASSYKANTTLLKGAKEAVILASKHAKVGLVTTKAHFFANEILKDFEIDKYFSVVVGGDEVSKCKPNPEPIFLALSRLASQDRLLNKDELQKIFDFNKVYMIGDTLNDTQAAKAAGVKPLVTLFEYTDINTLKKDCDLVFNTPLECVEHIINCEC